MRLWLRMLRRELGQRRGHVAALVVSSLLGVALFVASYGAYRNLVVSYDTLYQRTHAADLTVRGGRVDAFAEAARADAAVEAVVLRNVVESYARIADHSLLARVVGMPAAEAPAVNQILLLKGRGLSADQPRGVVLEQHLAGHYQLEPGDSIELRTPFGWTSVDVLGVAASPEYLWPARSRQEVLTTAENFGVLFAAQEQLRLLAGDQGREAVLTLREDAERDAALARLGELARAHGARDVVPRAEQASNAVLQEDIQGFGEMAVLFPVLFLGAAGLAAFVILARWVQAHRTLIGGLRANGVRARAPLMYHLAFGVLPVGLGGLLGAGAGEALALVVSRLYTQALSIPLTVIQPHPLVALAGMLMAVAAGALASAGPAWDAARVAPREAMAGPRPARVAGRLLGLFPASLRLPASVKLVVRSALRSPGRSLTTVAGVALSLVLVLTSLGMLDTVKILLDRQFQRIQTQDAEVYGQEDVRAGVLARVREVTGVVSAEPVAATPATLRGPQGEYATQLRAFRPDTAMHAFVSPDGSTVALPEEGVLLAAALEDRLGVRQGDALTIELPDQDASVEVVVAGFVQEPLGSFAYAALPFEVGNATLPPRAAYVHYAPGAERAAVRGRLQEVDGVVAVVDARTLARAVEELMGLFYVFVGIMLVFGGVLALALVYSTMSVNVAERSGELATLRAAGVRQGQLARIVGGENLLLVVLGLLPGLLIAWGVADAFLASFSSDMFRFDLHVRPLTWLLAALAVVAAALVSQIPALRAVARIDLAAAVRERGG